MHETQQPGISPKNEIKRRLIQNLVSLWNLKEPSISSLDPIVDQLFEGCSNEFYKIGNEIESSRVRVLQRLAKLLIPDSIIGPLPAHAILRASPADPIHKISSAQQFFIQRRLPAQKDKREQIEEIFFSPLSDYKLISGQIKWLVTPNHLARITEDFLPDPVTKLRNLPQTEPNFIWIGLSLNSQIEEINDLCFYFDWKNNPDRQTFFKILPYSRWCLENQELKATTGFTPAERSQNPYAPGGIKDLDERNLIERQISEIYHDNYVSVSSADDKLIRIKNSKSRWPLEMKDALPESDIKNLGEGLLWIKVVFPFVSNSTFFSDMSVAVNCIPVINRRLHRIRFRLQNHLNIVPLEMAGYFLAVRSVTSSDSKEYQNNKSRIRRLQEPGTYIVRSGGINRFDERDAGEYLQYLLELVRDESDAFAGYGLEFLAGSVKELSQSLNRLEQRVNANPPVGVRTPAFLIITPHRAGDTITVEYWSTDGEKANQIRSGTPVALYSGGELKARETQLITGTTGGRKSLNQNEMVVAFSDLISRRNRIVTSADYISFCRRELGVKLKSVQLRKGIQMSKLPGEGMMRTLDVIIEPNKELKIPLDEWQILSLDLQKKIANESRMDMPLRIFIGEKLIVG